MTRTYKCIPWRYDPRHTEEEVVAALRGLYGAVSHNDWVWFNRNSMQRSLYDSSWAHIVCRAHDRIHVQAEKQYFMKSLFALMRKLTSPARSNAPRSYSREVYIPANKGQGTSRTLIGYIGGQSTCIRTFLAPHMKHDEQRW